MTYRLGHASGKKYYDGGTYHSISTMVAQNERSIFLKLNTNPEPEPGRSDTYNTRI